MNTNDTTRDNLNRCHCPTCQGRAGTVRTCFNARKLAARLQGKLTTKTVSLVLLLASVFLQGRASAASAGQEDKASVGYLQVFSATEQAQWGEGSFYYPHTGYRIYDSGGKAVKWVENHETSIDEDPQKIELAPGAYTIWAQSDRGYVKTPVRIKPARLSTVHLEEKKIRE